MHVLRTPGSARAIARTLARPLGFVPTMGALHRGHLALIERARAENASVAASIFVNPLQFGPSEDFDRYPRAFEADAALLEEAGVDVLYAPSVDRMYPEGFSTRIEPGGIADRFEGAARPGHFSGVATVVVKLLHALEPTSLYLGQKDAQQVAVLRKVLRELDMPQSLIVHPTVREEDGLALSSRNVYLTPEQRAQAPGFYRGLRAAAAAIESGETNRERLLAIAAAEVHAPLEVEYLEIVDPQTFAPLAAVKKPALLIGAVRAGATRLLDNLPIEDDVPVHPVTLAAKSRAERVR